MTTRRRSILIIIATTAVAILVIVAITSVVISATKATSIRETQTTNTPLLENTNETLQRVRECTTPGEQCFEDGQQRTAAVVTELTNDLTRVSAYAAACADKPGVQGEDEIFACVIRQLTHHR